VGIVQKLAGHAVTVELADGKACFQMVLPMSEMLFDVAAAIEQTASQAGLLMMKAMIDDEVKELTGERYKHQPDRRAVRWGHDEGHVIFAGRKVAIDKESLLNLGGVYGDRNAGEPVEYDHLNLVLTDETIEITVFNRGIALFFTDDERIRRIHRVLCKLDRLGEG